MLIPGNDAESLEAHISIKKKKNNSEVEIGEQEEGEKSKKTVNKVTMRLPIYKIM